MDKREMHWRRGHVFWGQGSECVFCFGDREESELIHFFVPFLLLGHSLVINSLVICHFLAITVIIIITGTIHNSSDHLYEFYVILT